MSISTDEQKLARARERAALARMRFTNSLDSARRRLSPSRLRDDALVAVNDRVDQAKDDLGQAVRKHPLMVGAAAAGALALVFWKPARTAAGIGLRVAELVWFNRNLWRSRS